MPRTARRLVSLLATLTITAAGLAVTAPPASAADPGAPTAACVPEGSNLGPIVALDASYDALNKVPLVVDAENGLQRLVYNAPFGSGTATKRPIDYTSATMKLYQAPQRGTLTLNSDGSFIYTANATFPPSPLPTLALPDYFQFFADLRGICTDVATVYFSVAPNPVRAITEYDQYAIDYNDAFYGLDPGVPVSADRGVLNNDVTADGRGGSGNLRAVLHSQPEYADGSSAGTVELAPDGSFRLHLAPGGGPDQERQIIFWYRACPLYTSPATVVDGCSIPQVVRIGLYPPVNATDDQYDMAPDSAVLKVTAATGVLVNDLQYMNPGNSTWKPVTQPQHGQLEATSTQADGGAFTYRPDSTFAGTDSFRYVRCYRDTYFSSVLCSTKSARVDIRRASAPRVVSVTTPAPTSGEPFGIELSELVRGISSDTVIVAGPAPSSARVPVSLTCQYFQPSGGQVSNAILLTFPCASAAETNRIIITPATALDSPAQYTVTLNPNGLSVPGSVTGLQLPTTVKTVSVTSPKGVAPVITEQPADTTVRPLSGPASFTASVLGTPAPALLWQRSSDQGSTWVDLPSKVGTTLVVRPEELLDGARYRLRATNRYGTTYSRAAKLAVGYSPVITLQPHDAVNLQFTTLNFQFVAAADGVPAPAVQWQQSTDAGSTWTDVAGATQTTLSIAGNGVAGWLYRARFTNTAGSVTSSPAEVFVTSPFQQRPVITQQPRDVAGNYGDTARFSVDVTGVPTPTIQWQFALAGADEFEDFVGQTDPVVETGIEGISIGARVRAAVRNSAGIVYSAPASITLAAPPTPPGRPSVTGDPTDITVDEGDSAEFSVGVAGSPYPAVLWQTSSDGGATWELDQTTVSQTFVIPSTTKAQNGLLVRAVAISAGGNDFSEPATLTVVPDPVPVLMLPDTIEVTASGPSGAVVDFSATASDNDPAAPAVTCTPASGSTFPVGETQVSCATTDALGNEVTGTFLVRVLAADSDGPVLDGQAVLDPAPNADEWNKGPVTVRWSWSDAGTGVDPAACTTETVVTSSGDVTATCADLVGNSTTSPPTTVRIDAVAPTLAPTLPATLLLGATAGPVAPGASDTGGSGLASSSCSAITTATIGTRTVTCTATDKAGNTTSVDRSYTVLAQVSSFANPPLATFVAIRGTTLTARFTLAGAGGRLSSSASAALATAKVVRVALTGPRIVDGSPLTALCTWDTRAATFACPLAIPRTLASGTRNPYVLTVQLQTAASTWTAAQGARNKVTLYLL